MPVSSKDMLDALLQMWGTYMYTVRPHKQRTPPQVFILLSNSLSCHPVPVLLSSILSKWYLLLKDLEIIVLLPSMASPCSPLFTSLAILWTLHQHMGIIFLITSTTLRDSRVGSQRWPQPPTVDNQTPETYHKLILAKHIPGVDSPAEACKEHISYLLGQFYRTWQSRNANYQRSPWPFLSQIGPPAAQLQETGSS